jgi:hypothetical protein
MELVSLYFVSLSGIEDSAFFLLQQGGIHDGIYTNSVMAVGLVTNLFNPQRNFKTLRIKEGRGEEP